MPDPASSEQTSAERVAVVRALPGLGDALCAVPALRALRRTWPAAEVTVVGLRSVAWMRDRFPRYIDAWMPCDVWPGLPEIDGPMPAARHFIAGARARRFDLALQMHGSGAVSNGLTAALGARRWVGLTATPEAAAPAGGTLRAYPTDTHEVARCLAVARLAGAVDADASLEFPLRPDDHEQAAVWLGGAARIAVVHPGASVPERRWQAAGFAAVVRHLLARRDPPLDVVVITGGSDERALAGAVANGLEPADAARVLDLSGRTPLGPLAGVLARAEVVVANDTGVVHLAAAVGTPTVVVGGTSDWTRWRPLGCGHRAVGGPGAGGWPDAESAIAAVGEALGPREGERRD